MSKLIHSSWFTDLLGGQKIVILDGGARGDLFAPFDRVDPSVLLIVKVEPDAAAAVARAGNEVILRKAIWKETATINIHIANEPSVSSVYPPNLDFAARFVDVIGKPARSTRQMVEVEAASIDELFEQEQIPYPDLVKLDIHGCEYEALTGAFQSLKTTTVALVIESWLSEAHKGQQLLFKTDEVLHTHGFYPFETGIGSWDYKNAAGLYSKAQAVISESLYFKDVILRNEPLERVRGLKLIAIAELYGYTGFALLLADHLLTMNNLDVSVHQQISAALKSNNKRSAWSRFLLRIRNKLIRILSEK